MPRAVTWADIIFYPGCHNATNSTLRKMCFLTRPVTLVAFRQSQWSERWTSSSVFFCEGVMGCHWVEDGPPVFAWEMRVIITLACCIVSQVMRISILHHDRGYGRVVLLPVLQRLIPLTLSWLALHFRLSFFFLLLLSGGQGHYNFHPGSFVPRTSPLQFATHYTRDTLNHSFML